ncbi:hypothetical protein QUB05_30745 [Microcoleus sp. F10-C6]|uniref:hypothetical protein n=1 Tax=unclassified Microcoleus TaxID=2642155 RepID=UPI002FD1382C
MNNLKSILFRAFKVGIGFNIFTVVFAIFYVFIVEQYARPFNFKPSIELGTAVSGSNNIFSTPDIANYQIRPEWSAVESKFSFFIPASEFRADSKYQAPRLEKWCKIRNCCAHRMAYSDKRKFNFKCFTIDDWFFNNSNFLDVYFQGAAMAPLDKFLKNLPKGTRVIVNEPLILFQQNKLNFVIFEKWLLELVAKHPHLKFQVGIQFHFQWLDLQFFALSDGVLFRQLSQFSRQHKIPWGISEFSTYDRIWRRRLITPFNKFSDRGKFTSQIEAFIPDRLRRAFVLHQAYWVHREAVRSGARFAVEWGNFPLLWFQSEIDSDYRSTFALFDWQGNPQPMYWAIARGIEDGKKSKN